MVNLKISLAQTNIIWEDKKANETKASEMIEKAASEGSDLIVFPEMSLTGFSMNIDVISEYENDSETTRFFSEQAKKHHIYITFGAAIKDIDGAVRNQAITVDRNGAVISEILKNTPLFPRR